MNVGKIYLNDRIVPIKDLNNYATQFLHANFLYQTINTIEHKTLYLKKHLDKLSASFRTLYGRELELNQKKIERQIANLLHEGRLPYGGNTVNLIILPDGEETNIIIEHNKMTLYDGYAVMSLRPKAIIVNYEIPFERHLTSVSMQTAGFMNSFAQRSGLNMAIRANRKGLLISAGDYPLFAVKDNIISTVPIEDGGRDCAERDLMFMLCNQAGRNICEQPVNVNDLKSFDEIIIFTPTGLQSVLCCNNIYFHSSMASILDKELNNFTKKGLSSTQQ